MVNERVVLLCLLLVGGCQNTPASQTRADASAPTSPSPDAGSDSLDMSSPVLTPLDAGVSTGRNPDAGSDLLDLSPPPSTPPQLLLNGEAHYPRVIRLKSGAAAGTIVASVVAPQASGNRGGTILVSHDEGVSFAVAGHIDDARAASGVCCATLYEVPRAVGSLAAGTLLWAGSFGKDVQSQPMSIFVWSSVDVGRSWTFLGTVYTATVPRGTHTGLWEPEFAMLADGTLVCHYSDETDPAHSQKLVEARSSDGVSWGSYTNTVALTATGARPGMANVRQLPNGTYLMSYELCGVTSDGCAAHLRFSSDGWNWGDANDPGLQPTTVDGMYFAHAPTVVFSDRPGANGRWYLVGQMVYDSAGNPAPENGSVLFSNSESGTHNWYEVAAPVPVAVPAVTATMPYNACPNYSSSILPLGNGQLSLELATRYEGTSCHAYFARASLLGTGDASGVVNGDRKRLVNVMSGLCLDASAGSGAIQQATCNGTPAQSWSFVTATNGNFALKAQSSGQCLSGANPTSGAVTQGACDGSAAQSWTLYNVGIGSYELTHAGTSACLDDSNGSTASGNAMQLWSCNDLSPQIWHFESP
jgi:hypothetical protein